MIDIPPGPHTGGLLQAGPPVQLIADDYPVPHSVAEQLQAGTALPPDGSTVPCRVVSIEIHTKIPDEQLAEYMKARDAGPFLLGMRTVTGTITARFRRNFIEQARWDLVVEELREVWAYSEVTP